MLWSVEVCGRNVFIKEFDEDGPFLVPFGERIPMGFGEMLVLPIIEKGRLVFQFTRFAADGKRVNYQFVAEADGPYTFGPKFGHKGVKGNGTLQQELPKPALTASFAEVAAPKISRYAAKRQQARIEEMRGQAAAS